MSENSDLLKKLKDIALSINLLISDDKTGRGVNGNPATGSDYDGDSDLVDENEEKFPKALDTTLDIPEEEKEAEYMEDELTADQMESPAEREESSSDFPANDESSEIDYGDSGVISLEHLQKLSKELRQVIKSKNLNLKEIDGKLQSDLSFAFKKEIQTPTGDTYIPTPAQYKKIDALSLSSLPPEKWRVITGVAADQKTDRGAERFSQRALDRLLSLAIQNKIPLLMDGSKDHEWAQKNVYGLVFDGDTADGTLNYKIAIPVIEKTKPVLEAIMAGLYNKLSVGFALDPQNYMCSSCGKSMFSMACNHMPGMQDSKTGQMVHAVIDNVLDNFEVSGVAVPMQPEAHIRRNSADGNLSIKKVDNDKINNDSLVIEDTVMADEALDKVTKGDIDPEGHVPTPAEGSATAAPTDKVGIRRGKKAKLAKKVRKAAKNSKKVAKALKEQTKALNDLVAALTGVKASVEETKEALKTVKTVKSVEQIVNEVQPQSNNKSWIGSFLGDADLGGQE